jgi:hypothetical protein
MGKGPPSDFSPSSDWFPALLIMPFFTAALLIWVAVAGKSDLLTSRAGLGLELSPSETFFLSFSDDNGVSCGVFSGGIGTGYFMRGCICPWDGKFLFQQTLYYCYDRFWLDRQPRRFFFACACATGRWGDEEWALHLLDGMAWMGGR